MSACGTRYSTKYICLGAYCVSCQERLCKIKYDFEGSILDVDPGGINACFTQTTN